MPASPADVLLMAAATVDASNGWLHELRGNGGNCLPRNVRRRPKHPGGTVGRDGGAFHHYVGRYVGRGWAELKHLHFFETNVDHALPRARHDLVHNNSNG